MKIEDQFQDDLIEKCNINEKLAAEQSVGIDLLAFYISEYLMDNVKHVGIHEKRALRASCRRLKKLIDATVTHVLIDGKTEISSENDLIGFYVNGNTPQNQKPESFKRLRNLCETFPSLKIIKAPDRRLLVISFPDSIKQLAQSLTQLELAFHERRTTPVPLPYFLPQMTALRILSVTPQMERISILQRCTALEKLELELRIDKDNPQISDFIGVSNSLTFLNLNIRSTSAGPCVFPDSMHHLKKLQELNLNPSYIDYLPESFGGMSALTLLHLYGAKGLKSLPNSFTNLTALEAMCIEKCRQLEELPENFGNLTKLTQLEFRSCRNLRSLPSSFGNLSSLKMLKLERCHALVTMPDTLGDLKSLIFLVFEGCYSLREIGQSLTRMPSYQLEDLGIFGCPRISAATIALLVDHFEERVVEVRPREWEAMYDSTTPYASSDDEYFL
jgi:Leucine-rich repeat (LRR) protein